MIKAVVFDMFETLVTLFVGRTYFSEDIAKDVGFADIENYRREWHLIEHDRSIGKLTIEDGLTQVFKKIGIYSEEKVQTIVNNRLAALKDTFDNIPAESFQLLDALKERGIKIGLITNTFSDERDMIRSSALFPYFNVALISYEQGICKPAPEMYQRMIAQLGVKPEECLYVGDGGSRELYGARDAGMKAVQCTWFADRAYEPHIPCPPLDEFEHVAYQMDILKVIEKQTNEKLPKLPDSVKKLVEGKHFTVDDVGKSGSQIFIFGDSVLKIVPYDEKNDVGIKTMRWLEGKLPVPKILAYEADEDSADVRKHYILMSKVPGKMSCDEYYMDNPRELVKMLAKALKLLWSVDVTDCPFERSLDVELAEARYRVENNLVDVEDAEPTTFGEGGFKDPAELLAWLEENKPEYEPVLSHGDFCLPNVFIENGEISGYIDLNDCGIGDKWRDIALCYRSLKHNFDGTFGGKVRADFNPDILLEELGFPPNYDKMKYYILLDELF